MSEQSRIESDRAAIIYTLLQTTKLNGVNPQSWHAPAIEKITEAKMTKPDKLLPWNIRPEEI